MIAMIARRLEPATTRVKLSTNTSHSDSNSTLLSISWTERKTPHLVEAPIYIIGSNFNYNLFSQVIKSFILRSHRLELECW